MMKNLYENSSPRRLFSGNNDVILIIAIDIQTQCIAFFMVHLISVFYPE